MSGGIVCGRFAKGGFPRRWALGSVLVGALLGAPAWAAAPKDAAAIKLAEEAIDKDYLATNFAAAEKKLRNAAAMCGTTACSSQVRARVQRDLGVVLIMGLGRLDDGKKAFAEALKADPDVGLEKALTTPEIEQAFRAAKGNAGTAAAAPGAAASSASPAGDMVHTPAVEQLALTSVPIYVELPDGIAAVRVVARYKPYGTSEWKTLELRRLGAGYGAEVPCRDVGSTTGDFLYFVQATDAAGDVVSTSGSRGSPNKVAIKNALTVEAPHLPGVVPPTKCRDAADCPPGLAGCPSGKAAAAKGWGASCEQDNECNQGLWCKNGACDNGDRTDPGEPKSSGKMCDGSGECDAGETCTRSKVCEREAGAQKPKKAWLSLKIGQDISLMAAQTDICGTPQQLPSDQYTCIDQDGFAYKGVPQAGGVVRAGPHLATTRIMVGLDYLVVDNITLGARLGYAFGVAPGQGALSHLHGEARVTFWFGREPFARPRIRPFAFAAAGFAEVDDQLAVPVVETDLGKGLYPTQTLTAWRHSGGAFVGGGGGVMLPLGAGQGILAEFKFEVLVPDLGIAIMPTIGYALGL